MSNNHENSSDLIKIELSPTLDNIVNSYVKNPKSRKDSLNDFVELICSIKTHASIAIDGSWGSGKTFFVKQAKMIMDFNNQHICKKYLESEEKKKVQFKNSIYQLILNNPHICVYYDAWSNDNHTDPILSLIYAISSEFGINYTPNYDFMNSLKNLAMIFDKMLPINVEAFFESIKGLKGDDVLKAIRAQEKFKNNVNVFFNSILKERAKRIVIFIDELDRCSPLYAIKLLERIKHYFDNNNITFVFSVNKEELCITLRKIYGYNFDSEKYLERFFDRQIPMPNFDMMEYCKTFVLDDEFNHKIRNDIVNFLSLNLRETNRFLQSVNSFVILFDKLKSCGKYNEEFIGDINYAYKLLILPVLGLFAKDSKNRNKLLSGNGYELYKNLSDKIYDFKILSERLADIEGIQTKDEITKRIYASYSNDYAVKNNIQGISRFNAIRDVIEKALDFPEFFSNETEKI